jgi:hypothetical protein
MDLTLRPVGAKRQPAISRLGIARPLLVQAIKAAVFDAKR